MQLSQPAVSLAVKRVEEELGSRLFDRSGPTVVLTGDGVRAVRGFERMMEIFNGMKGTHADGETLRIGLSPLLSGQDVASVVGNCLSAHPAGFAVEFMDSDEIAQRNDFDVRVMVPNLKRRSAARVHLPTVWIGATNGVFIRSRQEPSVWDRAVHALVAGDIKVSRIVEVNDCGYAYHMASSGAGFTPCVMSAGNGFRDCILEDFPELAPVQLDIFAEPEIAEALKSTLAPDSSDLPMSRQAAS